MRLIHIYKTYHNKNNDVLALNDINLSLDNHGMTFIVGSSGCGKTTLLNIISGHDLQFEGTIEKDGLVECIEQDITLLENMSIIDNLKLVSDDKELIQQYLKQFQLPDQHRKVKKLSVGEKKRVQIIRSLLTKADYLICDEPTASLDYENSQMIMELLKEVSKNIGVIIVTHDIALVERYQDRVIQMGKGCILEDEPVKEATVSTHEIIMKKQPLTKQFVYLVKMFRSRLAENIFKYVLLFLGVITVYVLICLYPSLNASMSGRTNWLNGNNVIITEPIDTTTKCVAANICPYQHYDFYKKEDVYLAHDNIDGIIGYNIGWNTHKYSNFEIASAMLNIDGLREIVEKYSEEYKLTNELPFWGYNSMVSILSYYDEKYPNVSFAKDEYISFDFSSYRGIKISEPFIDTVLTENGSSFQAELTRPLVPMTKVWLSIEDQFENIAFYELFPEVELDLMLGNMPSKENEILVDQDFANILMKYFRLSSLEELVGHKTYLSFFSGIPKQGFKRYDLIISGITYMYSNLENQIFAYDGTFEKPFIEDCNYDPDLVTYQYLNFLADPKKDSEVIAEQLNRLLESKDSQFEVLGMSSDVREEYQDPLQIVVFTSFTLFALLVLYLMMQILFNRRIVKEHNILHRYHYQPLFIQLMLLGLLMVLVALPQLGLFTYICDFLNQLANHLGMADIVTYDTLQYLKTWIIIFVVMGFIEGGLYVFRTKKHS